MAEQSLHVLAAGGDLRYMYMARALAKHHTVHVVGFSERTVSLPELTYIDDADTLLPHYDLLVLPLPVTEDGLTVHAPFSNTPPLLDDMLSRVKPGGLVVGGQFGAAAMRCKQAGFAPVDYLAREELCCWNAVPTAEGALQILLEELPFTIYRSRMLVLGFGRCGSRLAGILQALGAAVTVASCSCTELAKAEMLGCTPLPLEQLAAHVGAFSVVCNTIPARVLDAHVLAAVPPETLILDLASKPGGVDLEAAKQQGNRVVWALSLPGKTAPITAGELIAKTVTHILHERGVLHA